MDASPRDRGALSVLPDRVAGRGSIDSRGFPVGCVGRQCSLCERRGSFPLPAWWSGDSEAESLAGPSVQVVAIPIKSMPWAVIAFVSERYVDGRFPIVGARSASEAIDLALARGAQLRPRSKLEVVGPGQWRVGEVAVLCANAGQRRDRAGQCHD